MAFTSSLHADGANVLSMLEQMQWQQSISCVTLLKAVLGMHRAHSQSRNCAGNFEAGVVSGEGTWTYSNGDMYKGSFVDGKKHGTGCYHFAKPKCQFIGSFDAGAFVSGRWMLSDGSFVDAAFAAGDAAGVYIPAGTATCKFAQAGLVQEGTFGPGMTWQGQAISAA